jgi:hypothetical protein
MNTNNNIKTMKTTYKYCLAMVFALFMFTSCEKETEDLSSSTHLCELTLNGATSMAVPMGETFTDPGYKAIEGERDVTSNVTVTGSVNTAQAGTYVLTYTIKNTNGFITSKKRTVLVTDKSTFSGAYFGESEFGVRHYYDAPVEIAELGYGFFEIDDILGGFYNYGRYPGYGDYGYDFMADATLKLNADNTISLIGVGEWYFDDSPIEIVVGIFDPDNGKVTLTLDFDGTPFYVILTK